MKKSVVLLASLFLLSCSSDSDTPAVRCNCGTITKIVVGGTINGNTMMIYTVKNNCTGEILTIQKINTDGNVGDEICN
jgi:hypothetical protein